MGRSAKIRHRRRRRLLERKRLADLLARGLAEMILAPLRERRLYPLGFVPVAVDDLTRATETALRDLSAPSVPADPGPPTPDPLPR